MQNSSCVGEQKMTKKTESINWLLYFFIGLFGGIIIGFFIGRDVAMHDAITIIQNVNEALS